MSSRSLSIAALVPLSLAVAACAGPVATEDPNAGRAAQPIEGGAVATGYPEAVILDVDASGQPGSPCSGALIAPRVVLTSAHCASAAERLRVLAPFADNQQAEGQGATASQAGSGQDVGLVFLDTPITLDAYPQIASADLPDGDQVVSVGRALDGQASSSACYVSPPFTVTDATSLGFADAYAGGGPLDDGDAGGPVFVLDTHTIVAVSSGSSGETAILARVDTLSAWIAQQVAAYGGAPSEPGWPGDPGWPGWPGEPGGHGDGHGDGHGNGQGDGHGNGHGPGWPGGPGDGHGDGHGSPGQPGGGHH